MGPALHVPHFSNLRPDKITMLVKYDKTCIDSSTFVNRAKDHCIFDVCTPHVFLFTDVVSNDDLEQESIRCSFVIRHEI